MSFDTVRSKHFPVFVKKENTVTIARYNLVRAQSRLLMRVVRIARLEYKRFYFFRRRETQVSLLRETVRLRDESARPRTATPSGHQGGLSVLFADVHQEQHGQETRRARTQNRVYQPQGLPTVQSLALGQCAAVTAPPSLLSSSPSSPRGGYRSAGDTGQSSDPAIIR